MMQNKVYWNRDWQFFDVYTEDLLEAQTQCRDFELVTLPHTTAVTPYHYFDEAIYQKICGYRRCFHAEESWKYKHVLMTVEAAGHHAKVYLNGTLLAEHACGYTAFQVDLSKAMCYDMENVLVIQVDSREQQNLPPFGHVIDYMTFGGLYREVYIEVKEDIYISDVFAKTFGIVKGEPILQSDLTIHTPDTPIYLQTRSEETQKYNKISCESMAHMSHNNLSFRQQIIDKSTGEVLRTFAANTLCHDIKGLEIWDIEHPALYVLRTELLQAGKVIDTREDSIGFREAVFHKDGFYLNGRKVKIRGLNRHQSYPYVGYAMPKSMQRLDADILKKELGVNAVRTSHYPQSHYFLDRCDELGLLVFTEIPGWQHIGDEDWKQQAVINTEEMVTQYRNHPSIILWGVRINESQDDDIFYRKTNAIAHKLDPTRQTSGVRFIQKSSLLEDVYAFNDFSHEGNNAGCKKKNKVTSDPQKGYLISEYNGHMYPTKAFDDEEHRVEHMLRHARVMNAYYGESDIAGGFAWCMFDYNTHQDFGSGDRICYHGVCDMFRNPKLAAALYQSQSEQTPVLEISSSMDIGEHPACLLKDVYAITNAECVNLYKNDRFIRSFHAKDTEYANLPHGPIKIDDFIGDSLESEEHFSKGKARDIKKILLSVGQNGLNHIPPATLLLAAKCMLLYGMKYSDAVELYNKYIGNWGGTATVYRFEAIQDRNVVKAVIKKPMKQLHLEVTCSHTTLLEGQTYDVAAIRIRACNEDGAVLSFSQAPIKFVTTGDIELIGPGMTSLHGGMGGTYVKTMGKTGHGQLVLQSEVFPKVTIDFTVIQETNDMLTQ